MYIELINLKFKFPEEFKLFQTLLMSSNIQSSSVALLNIRLFDFLITLKFMHECTMVDKKLCKIV